MPHVYSGVLLLAGLALSHAAQAQALPDTTNCPACQLPCRPDTTRYTEQNNRLLAAGGAALAVNRNGTPFGGLDLEFGVATRPRLTLGVHSFFTFHTASATNYGLEATAPALAYATLTGSARYQLLNTRRWRLEGLLGLGLGWVQLVDRDQEITTQTYDPNSGTYLTTVEPAPVATSLHAALETGLGISYKLQPHLWLTSRLSYTQLPGRDTFGKPNEFSYWQLAVGVAVPWGWR